MPSAFGCPLLKQSIYREAFKNLRQIKALLNIWKMKTFYRLIQGSVAKALDISNLVILQAQKPVHRCSRHRRHWGGSSDI